jgi:hypothetical protein
MRRTWELRGFPAGAIEVLMNPIIEFGMRKPPCATCVRIMSICPFCALTARNMFAAGLPRFARQEHPPGPDWSWKPGRREVRA